MPLSPALDWSQYRQQLLALPYGKMLPNAVYLHRDTDVCTTGTLAQIVSTLSLEHEVGPEFNIIKFRLDAPRISFLCYPDFFEQPHPALQKAIAIDLLSGRSVRSDYGDNLNPPIIHRKELFLSPDHPMAPTFAALSAAEEQAGLYDSKSVIGFLANWERLLAAKGLAFEGHSLVEVPPSEEFCSQTGDVGLSVDRHRTALTRYELSRPVKTLVEYGLISSGSSFLDYGCGLGADIRGLQEMGIQARGWDPVHAPDGVRTESEIVNLGYVLNVIEDPAERAETLIAAWSLTRRLLVVSALIGAGGKPAEGVAITDGVLTRRNTFQKYFSQAELQHYIEDALEAAATPVSLGIFYVFRDQSDQQLFLQSRFRRNIDWKSLRIVRRAEPPSRAPRKRVVKPDRFSAHQELLDELWQTVLSLGRLPLSQEFPRYSEVSDAFGSPKRTLRFFASQGRQHLLEQAAATRKADLLVYLAISSIRRVIAFSSLPETIRQDITVFFGNYKRALAEGHSVLHSAADAEVVSLACEESSVGWQDERSLYVHTRLIDRLPTVLRVLIACAEVLYGDIHQADIVRIHKLSGKITFLSYADFDSAILPALRIRTRVNLRTLQVDTFDHEKDGQLLYFKERFVDSSSASCFCDLEASDKLRSLGIPDSQFLGPRVHELREVLRSSGMQELLDQILKAGDSQA